MKWEYKSTQLPFEGSAFNYKDLTELLKGYDSFLNENGEQSWDLVNVISPGVVGPKKILVAIFKRPKVPNNEPSA